MGMIIYLITNKINGKKYVGLDKNLYDCRWKDHIRHSKTDNPIQLIDRKIKQYGVKNFDYQIIYQCDSLDELKKKEIEFIQYYDTYVGNGKGYNLTLGGDGCVGFKMPLDKIKKGETHYMYGKKRTVEEKIQRSLSMKGKNAGDKNVFKRPEIRKLLSEIAKKRIGKLNPNFKYNIDRESLYDYYIKNNNKLKQTSQFFKCSDDTIVRKLREYGISKNTI